MRTLAHTFKSLLVAWLCLVSVANLQAIPDFVLCIGEDGHVDLEFAVNDRCGGEPSGLGTAGLVPEAVDHCGDCSDIPLFSESTQSFFKKMADKTGSASQSGFPPIATLFSAPIIHLIEPIPRDMRSVPPPLPSPALASIRSVRLLV